MNCPPLLTAILVFSLLPTVYAQGTFQNLDFESSTVSPLPPGQAESSVSMVAAFPGWIGYLGTNLAPSAAHNTLALEATSLSILGPSYSSRLQGNFTAALQAGVVLDFSSGNIELIPAPASIAQFGSVPTGIQSIMFYSGFARPEVTFNGELIPVALLGTGVSGTGTAYEILGGDMSSFAGQTGELRFSSIPPASGPPQNLTLLDNIFFSSQPIPEPSALCLLGLGGLLVGWRWRRSG